MTPLCVPSPHRLRVSLIVVLVSTALGAGLMSASAAVSGRPTPPTERLLAARMAVGRARLGGAARWAPDELARAIAVMTTAEAEYSRESDRLWPARDFSAVRARLWTAENAAHTAHRKGEEHRIRARLEAEDAVEDTARLLRAGEALTHATTLPRKERIHLARARLLVAEAQAHMEREEYLLAGVAAERGRSELVRALGPAVTRAQRYTSLERVKTWKRWIEQTRVWSQATGRAAIVVVNERNELAVVEG